MSIGRERGRLAFEKAERDLVRLLSGQRPEYVHDFRTSTRRLQTLLEQLTPRCDRNQKKILKMLSRIRKRSGKVRDLDVQLAALRSLKVPQEPRRKTQLIQGLIEVRTQHERKLRKMLTKDKIRELRKRLRRAAKEIEFETCRDPLAVARELVEQAARPGPPTEEMLHQYRLVVKRARYAAEFAPASAKARQFMAQMKRLQDAIGNWHDWLTLTQTAARRFGEISQSPLVAVLHNLTAGKFRHAVAAVSTSPAAPAAPKPVPAPSKPSRKTRARNALIGQADSAA